MELLKENRLRIGDKKCTGCAGCANICPRNAIYMSQDDNGFYKPRIQENKCVKCSLCESICPILNYKEENEKNPDVYAVMADDKIREVSSSGGAFTVLAEYVLEKSGYVVGAAFDKDWEVEHIIVNNKDDLAKLRGSKYVQSRLSSVLFQNIKKILEEDKYVLFSGCPCQVAGLKYFLKKDYDKLILVDFLCSLSPSPKVYKKYLEWIVPDKSNLLKINFRDKSLRGWSCTHTTTTTTGIINDWKFMHSFLSKTIMSEACESCKFATLPRQSDITIADFWGIHKYKKSLDDKKGTSIFMPNNIKGKNIYNAVKCKFIKKEKVPIEYAMQKVLKEPFKPNKRREKFFDLINKFDFIETYKQCFGKQNNIGIMNFWYVPNRGAILTNYALNQFLQDQGYNAKTINYIPYSEVNYHKDSISEDFEKKYLSTTCYCQDYIDLKKLNKNIGTFLVGSDQVFRDWCVRHHRDRYFLNFAHPSSKTIAVAASFGIPYYDGSNENKYIMKKYLQRFDAISVREDSGVDILRDDFGIDSIQIMDPVFYIDRNYYDEIAATSSKKEDNFLAYYILTMTPQKKKAIEYVSKKLNLTPINIKGDLPVEDWLYYIRNCKFYMGDSFHGTCFSIIFRKPFISISPRKDDFDTRYKSILKLLNLEDRQISYYADEVYTNDDLLNDIDYSPERLKSLDSEIQRSANWLLNSIEAEKSKENIDEEFYAIMDRLNIEACENRKYILLLHNKYKIFFMYYLSKLLFNVTFGEKRQHFKDIKYKYKQAIKEFRSLNV